MPVTKIRKRKRPKFTPQARVKFLRVLALTGSMQDACTSIGITAPAIIKHRKNDPEFDAECEAAKETSRAILRDELEGEARRRAIEGVEKGIYFQGARVAVEREYSDSILLKMLQAHVPEYKRKVELTGADGAALIPDTVAAAAEDRLVRAFSERGLNLAQFAQDRNPN